MDNEIKQKIPMEELMAGLAEECAELAQAALKLRRVWDGTNPTPVKEEEAIEKLYEEAADVYLYLSSIDLNMNHISQLMIEKQKRWKKRLEA